MLDSRGQKRTRRLLGIGSVPNINPDVCRVVRLRRERNRAALEYRLGDCLLEVGTDKIIIFTIDC